MEPDVKNVSVYSFFRIIRSRLICVNMAGIIGAIVYRSPISECSPIHAACSRWFIGSYSTSAALFLDFSNPLLESVCVVAFDSRFTRMYSNMLIHRGLLARKFGRQKEMTFSCSAQDVYHHH